ncbi:YdgA family protein [Vibrio sp.]|nr:YdgA family protein [Vibrio sp.]
MDAYKKIGAIGGGIGLVLCWPLAVGQIGQSAITEGVQHLSNKTLTAELVEYDRGYFSATATTKITINDPVMVANLQADDLPTEYTINSDISHGIVSLSALSKLESEVNVPVTLETSTQLNGNTSFDLQIDNWNFSAGGNAPMTVSISPSHFKGHMTVLGELSYNMKVPSVEVDFFTGEKITLIELNGEGQGKQKEGFWLGDQTITLHNLSINDSIGKTLFEVNKGKYQFVSSSNDKEKRLTTKHKLDADYFLISGGQIQDYSLDAELSGIDHASFAKVMEFYQNNPNPSQQDVAQVLPYIETIFARGFNVTLNDMSLLLSGSEFNTQWDIIVPDSTATSESTSTTATTASTASTTTAMATKGLDPQQVMLDTTGTVKVFFSNQLVSAYPFIKQSVDEAIVMDMITEKPDGYYIDAQIEKGQFVFESGHKIPMIGLFLPMLLQ